MDNFMNDILFIQSKRFICIEPKIAGAKHGLITHHHVQHRTAQHVPRR